MQQTERYKLNLIESSDPFLPNGLNQNTQKVEEVLAAQEAASDQKLAEVAGRVTALEAHRFIIGSYHGDGANIRFVPLGFTPSVIFVTTGQYAAFAINGFGCEMLKIEEGGIRVRGIGSDITNSRDGVYSYFAFV